MCGKQYRKIFVKDFIQILWKKHHRNTTAEKLPDRSGKPTGMRSATKHTEDLQRIGTVFISKFILSYFYTAERMQTPIRRWLYTLCSPGLSGAILFSFCEAVPRGMHHLLIFGCIIFAIIIFIEFFIFLP